MTELPNGWESSSIGNVAEIIRGVTYSKADTLASGDVNAVPLLRATNLEVDSIDFDDMVYVAARVVKPIQILKLDDILLAASSGSIAIVGKSAQVIKANGETFGAFCAVIRPKDVHPKYLAYWVQSPTVRDHWSATARGSNINNLKPSDISGTQIPLPPIDEQHKSVQILEDHLSRLNAAMENVIQAKNLTSVLLASSLKHLVESVPHKYRPLSEVVAKIEAGKSLTCLGRPAQKNEWGIIKVSAMTWGEFLPDENKAIPASYSPPMHHKINKGDVLISRANTEKYVGAAVQVKTDPGMLLLSDKSLRLVPREEFDRSWLLSVLNAPNTREEISNRATGTKDSMRNISQSNLLAVEVPVPLSFDGQIQIMRTMGQVESSVNSNLQLIDESIDRIRNFRRSLLQAAFTGQLTKGVVSV
jgi:type I restriction enzyme S subunit